MRVTCSVSLTIIVLKSLESKFRYFCVREGAFTGIVEDLRFYGR